MIEAVANDLRNSYINRGNPEFYLYYVLSPNPKLYPISGLQHFIGTGFVASRLVSFLLKKSVRNGDSEQLIATTFLAGVLHDFNKWYVSREALEQRVIPLLKETQIYNAISELLGEKSADNAIRDAIEIGLKLESGGLPRNLQFIGEAVRVADILTGSEDSWNISACINRVLTLKGIETRNILPVVIGKQRPLVSLVSEHIEEKLEEADATPLISTPEGMLFLVEDVGKIDATKIYRDIATFITSEITGRTGESTERSKATKKKKTSGKIDVYNIKDFLDGKRTLQTYSRTYKPLSAYSTDVIEGTFNDASRTVDGLRLFVVVLGYIYQKTAGKKGLSEYIEAIGLFDKVKAGKGVAETLRNIYNVLYNLDKSVLLEVATKAKKFIVRKISEMQGADIYTLTKKLVHYLSIGYQGYYPIEEGSLSTTIRCSVCREPIVRGRLELNLRDYLSRLGSTLIRGLNISELFHPDVQANPEKIGSIEAVKERPVCEVCFFEAVVAPTKIGYMDGLWAAVLQYYPSMSIDLIKAIKKAVGSIYGRKEREIVVIPDYMTSRVIISLGSKTLDRISLILSLDLWYFFGGNLKVTTTAIGTAFVGSHLPVELEVSDAIIEEAVAKYMEMLRRAPRQSSYMRFTKQIRLWLYRTLRDYVESLETKRGEAKTTSLVFSRAGVQATGFPMLDVYSRVIETIRKGKGVG